MPGSAGMYRLAFSKLKIGVLHAGFWVGQQGGKEGRLGQTG